MRNLRSANTEEIATYINSFDEWTPEQYDALCELADRAGVDEADFHDICGDLNTHYFILAIQNALGVDLGE